MPPVKKSEMDAARAEVNGHARRVKLVTKATGEHEFTLPPELPFAVVAYFPANRIYDAIEALFDYDDEQVDRFMKARASVPEVGEFMETVMESYGTELGEASASSSS